MSGTNPASTNSSSPSSFLARLEYREDLERICTRLVGDALFAYTLAKRQAQKGNASEAVRCRAIARESARRALYILWAFRAADSAVTAIAAARNPSLSGVR